MEMDVILQGQIDGIDTARQIRSKRDTPIIYLSAYTDEMLYKSAKDTAPFGYLSKPFSDSDLRNTIEMALYKHNAEKALRQEKEFTEKAINSQIDTFFVFDPMTGKAIRWNNKFREISGYTDEEIADFKAPDSYYSPEDLEKAAAVINDVLIKGQGTVGISLICKDGRRVPTEYLASAIKDEENNIKYIISIGRDITERKQAQEKISRSEKELSSIYDAITDFLTVINIDYSIARVNRIVENQYGKDLIGKVCYEVYQGRKEICPDCPTRKAIETKKPAFSFQPGTEVSPPVEIYAFPIFDEEGEVTAVVEHGKDITERKQAQEKISRSEKELRSIYDAITDMLTVISPDYRIISANRVVEKQWGKDLIGKVCYKTYQGRDEICPDCPTKKAIGTKEPAFSFQPGTDVSPPVEIYAFPILDEEGEVTAVVEHGKDITERKWAEEDVKKEINQLK
jgi:PAS domain S-box-containing protein